jgi:hypothetical protein
MISILDQFSSQEQWAKDLPTGLISSRGDSNSSYSSCNFSYPCSRRNVKRIDEVIKLVSKEAMSP